MSRRLGSAVHPMICTGLAFLLALSVACGSAPPPPPPGPLVVVLLDVSGSTAGDALRARYLADLQPVVSYVAEAQGRLYVDLIDENPLAHAELPVQADFRPSERVAGNKLYTAAERSKKHKQAVADIKALLARSAPGTDILGGILLADRLFRREAAHQDKSLVLFSDMVQTADVSLPQADLSEQGIETLLERLRAAGRLANLEGTRVYVVGAGVSADTERPPDRILAIERFWRTYFGASGAVLVPGTYAGRLVRFP